MVTLPPPSTAILGQAYFQATPSLPSPWRRPKLPDVEFQGRVTRIDLQSLNYRGDVTCPVTINLDQPPADLRWGMTTLVEIQVQHE